MPNWKVKVEGALLEVTICSFCILCTSYPADSWPRTWRTSLTATTTTANAGQQGSAHMAAPAGSTARNRDLVLPGRRARHGARNQYARWSVCARVDLALAQQSVKMPGAVALAQASQLRHVVGHALDVLDLMRVRNERGRERCRCASNQGGDCLSRLATATQLAAVPRSTQALQAARGLLRRGPLT